MQDKIVKTLFLSIAVFIGCSNQQQPVAPATLSIDELSNTTYNILVKNKESRVVLLGRIRFNQIENDQISGSWNLETWGKNSLFPTLPLFTGQQISENASLGSFSGTVFGDQVIVKMPLPASEKTLGVIIKGVLNEKLVGRITLLPGMEFDGNFEAIRSM